MKSHPWKVAPWLLLSLLAGCQSDTQDTPEAPLTLAIAHINDTHSHFDGGLLDFNAGSLAVRAPVGGYPRVKAQSLKVRQWAHEQGLPFLFLHGGDAFQGSLYFTNFKGQANAALLNDMGLDAMVVGNHEFDLGNEPLAQFIGKAQFPVLASNMDLSREDQAKAHPLAKLGNFVHYDAKAGQGGYLIKTVNGQQVGLFGLVLEDAKVITSPDQDVDFHGEVATAKGIVAALKAKGVDKVVMLSHIGLVRDQAVADAVPDIDVIVGGHSHTLLGDFSNLGLAHEQDYAQMRGTTCIVQAGQYAEALGFFTVSFDSQGQVTQCQGHNTLLVGDQFSHDYGSGKKTPVSAEDKATVDAFIAGNDNISLVAEDAAMRQLIDQDFKPQVEALNNQVIALVPKTLDHVRIPGKARGGAPLPVHGSEVAPLIAESMYQNLKAMNNAVDVTIQNSGGVRDAIKEGKLTVGLVAGGLLPFSNPLVTFKLKGSDLAAALEGAIDNAVDADGVMGTGDGAFPYTGHLRFTYDGNQPRGQRLTVVELLDDASGQWQPLDPARVYKVGSTAFTASGKEGYQALLHRLPGSYVDTGYLDNAAFIDFAKAQGTLKPLPYQVVTYQAKGQ